MVSTILLVGLWLSVVGCATTGLTPSIRKNENDGEGRYIFGCKNISVSSVGESYITGSYLSTRGSAFIEGIQSGFDHPLYNRAGWRNAKQSILSRMPSNRTFCNSYTKPFIEVSTAISKVVKSLGLKLEISDIENGIFQTKVNDEQLPEDAEKALNRFGFSARWKERYFITVEKINEQTSDVKVFRELKILRGRVVKRRYKKVNTKKKIGFLGNVDYTRSILTSVEIEWDKYNNAYSNGHNEAWILGQILNISY